MMHTDRRNTPPGPRGFPIIGVLPRVWQNPLQYLLDAACRYGDVVQLRLGPSRVYLLSRPDDIKYVLQDNARNYRKSPRIKRIRPLFGNGLTTSEGEVWRRQRRLMQPAFQPQRLAPWVAVMSELTATMLERWHPLAARGHPLDIAAEMAALTQRMVGATLLRTDLGREVETVSRAMAVVEEELNRRVWALLDVPLWIPTLRNRRLRHALCTLERVVDRLRSTHHSHGDDTGDLLSMLMRARDPETGQGMDETQWRDEVLTLLFAGRETTAAALAWTWALLAQHPPVQARLHREVVAVLGGRAPTATDLPHLSYTKRVIEEALRLYPPTWITARTPLQNDDIGGYAIPAGSVVLLSPYVMHRHPRFWEAPTVFDPERFTPVRAVGRPHYAYFPFGGGPRRCLGEHFAMREAQLIVAMVAQRYRLQLVSGHPVIPQPLLALRPRDGVRVMLHPYTHQ
jgi:cytochrome P450